MHLKRFKSTESSQAAYAILKTAKQAVSHSRQKSARAQGMLSPKAILSSPIQDINDRRSQCQLDLVGSVKNTRVQPILYQSFRGESEKSGSSDCLYDIESVPQKGTRAEKLNEAPQKCSVKPMMLEPDEVIDT